MSNKSGGLTSSFVPAPKIFPYARASAVIHDPSGALESAERTGAFDLPCPFPNGSTVIAQALQKNGKLPVNSAFGGLGGGRIILAIISLAMLAVGFFCLLLRVTRGGPSIIIALVLFFVGGLLAAVTIYSIRVRRRNLHHLGVAWRNGWVRFARARVGGVWIAGATEHNRTEDHTHEVRYRYRAIAEVLPDDGNEPFTITTEEFSAPSDSYGRPYSLILADNPLDVLEPEHFNGWTIARYLAHDPHNTATICTDLSSGQVKAAIEAANGRP